MSGREQTFAKSYSFGTELLRTNQRSSDRRSTTLCNPLKGKQLAGAAGDARHGRRWSSGSTLVKKSASAPGLASKSASELPVVWSSEHSKEESKVNGKANGVETDSSYSLTEGASREEDSYSYSYYS